LHGNSGEADNDSSLVLKANRRRRKYARGGNMPLPDNGWTEQQAQGLFESLNLDGGTPEWKWEHLHRLRLWCSAHGKDSATIDGQLEFVAADLCDTYEGIGVALKRATTVGEARAAVLPYINRVTATLPWSTAEANLLRFVK
jgi:hypothetical protein